MLQAVSSNNKQMSLGQSIIVRGNESCDDSSVLHLAPGWERCDAPVIFRVDPPPSPSTTLDNIGFQFNCFRLPIPEPKRARKLSVTSPKLEKSCAASGFIK